jgi:hypothetical protein
VLPKGLGKLEKIHLIRMRSHDFLVCSVVPQPLHYCVPPYDVHMIQEILKCIYMHYLVIERDYLFESLFERKMWTLLKSSFKQSDSSTVVWTGHLQMMKLACRNKSVLFLETEFETFNIGYSYVLLYRGYCNLFRHGLSS